ncbi:putative G-protein coupled receptor [Sarcoptes scabiei]|nr:putative G-protein coupled receptor [Sarcoptes scabiei]
MIKMFKITILMILIGANSIANGDINRIKSTKILSSSSTSRSTTTTTTTTTVAPKLFMKSFDSILKRSNSDRLDPAATALKHSLYESLKPIDFSKQSINESTSSLLSSPSSSSPIATSTVYFHQFHPQEQPLMINLTSDHNLTSSETRNQFDQLYDPWNPNDYESGRDGGDSGSGSANHYPPVPMDVVHNNNENDGDDEIDGDINKQEQEGNGDSDFDIPWSGDEDGYGESDFDQENSASINIPKIEKLKGCKTVYKEIKHNISPDDGFKSYDFDLFRRRKRSANKSIDPDRSTKSKKGSYFITRECHFTDKNDDHRGENFRDKKIASPLDRVKKSKEINSKKDGMNGSKTDESRFIPINARLSNFDQVNHFEHGWIFDDGGGFLPSSPPIPSNVPSSMHHHRYSTSLSAYPHHDNYHPPRSIHSHSDPFDDGDGDDEEYDDPIDHRSHSDRYSHDPHHHHHHQHHHHHPPSHHSHGRDDYYNHPKDDPPFQQSYHHRMESKSPKSKNLKRYSKGYNYYQRKSSDPGKRMNRFTSVEDYKPGKENERRKRWNLYASEYDQKKDNDPERSIRKSMVLANDDDDIDFDGGGGGGGGGEGSSDDGGNDDGDDYSDNDGRGNGGHDGGGNDDHYSEGGGGDSYDYDGDDGDGGSYDY